MNGGCVCSSVSKETEEKMHVRSRLEDDGPSSLGIEKRIKE